MNKVIGIIVIAIIIVVVFSKKQMKKVPETPATPIQEKLPCVPVQGVPNYKLLPGQTLCPVDPNIGPPPSMAR